MKKNKKIILILFLIILPYYGFSYGSKASKLIKKGTYYLLNLEQKKAKQTFNELLRLKPNHPVSYFYMSFAMFITDLNTFEKKDKIESLKNYIIQGNYYAKKLEKPNEYDKLYIIAMKSLYGFLKFRQSEYASAIATALELLVRIQTLYKEHPNFQDGKLGIGIIHMIVTQIPGTLKKILAIINFKGDSKKAVSLLNDVIHKGKYFSDPARSLLAFYKTFYLKKFNAALKDYRILKNKYPRNFFYYLNEIYVRYYQKKYKLCFKLINSYKNKLADILKDSKYAWRFRFDFIEARIHFEQKNYKRSLQLFQSVIKKRIDHWNKDFYCVYSILYRGMIYDLINKRGLALNSYYLLKRNLEKSFHRAKRYAEMFIDKPFKPKDPRVYKKKKKKSVTLN